MFLLNNACITWLTDICVTNDHGHAPSVVMTIRFFPHSWLIIGFVTRHYAEQEMLTLPEHTSPPSVFSGFRVARSLVFCVMFCRSLFVLLCLFVCLLRDLSFDLRSLIIPIIPVVFSTFSYRSPCIRSLYGEVIILCFF